MNFDYGKKVKKIKEKGNSKQHEGITDIFLPNDYVSKCVTQRH